MADAGVMLARRPRARHAADLPPPIGKSGAVLDRVAALP
jgi:hypothetical protein